MEQPGIGWSAMAFDPRGLDSGPVHDVGARAWIPLGNHAGRGLDRGLAAAPGATVVASVPVRSYAVAFGFQLVLGAWLRADAPHAPGPWSSARAGCGAYRPAVLVTRRCVLHGTCSCARMEACKGRENRAPWGRFAWRLTNCLYGSAIEN